MSHSRSLFVLLLLACGLLSVVACDPLAPDPPRVVVVLTPTATQPPTSTPEPTTTSTPTPPPPTLKPTATPFVCGQKQGQIVNLTLASKANKGDVPYRVYLPPCYAETTRRYPYVILLHGSDQDQTEWTDLLKVNEALETGLQVGALAPMILVMPGGGDLANANVFKEGASWESVIASELIPEVEKNLCVWNAREGRAIGGVSRGGFWAFEIAFRHVDLFGAVGGHSPFFDAQIAGPTYNPLSLAKTVHFPPGLQPRIWIDAGKDDYARPNIEIFQKTLAGRNIDPGYTMNPTGKHEVPYWAQHVTEYLTFYGQTWPRAIEDLPSCLQ